MTKEETGVRALSRGLRLLEILAQAPDGLPLARITAKAGLSKSSAHRLLQTLILNGYAIRDRTNGLYFPSLKLLQLSSALIQQTNLHVVATPHLEELADLTGETVHLVLWDGEQAVYVEKVESPNPIRMYSNIGNRVPLHCTGVGKAILAHLPPEKLDAIVQSGPLPRFTGHTITDPQALRDHLAQIRQRGYAVDDGEHEEHVRCIAAPLFARNGRVVGAISIAAVSYRVDLDTLQSWWPSLKEHADQLNVELMHYFERYG